MINRQFVILIFIVIIIGVNYSFAQKNEVKSVVNDNTETNSLCFSKGGSIIFFNRGNRISYMNVNGKSEITLFPEGHKKKILSIDLSNDSSRIISGGQDSLLILWNLKGEIIRRLNYHKGIVTTVKFDPTGNYIFSGSTDRRLICYSISENRIIFDVKIYEDDILSIDISNNGKFLAVSGAKGASYLLDPVNGEIIRKLTVENWVRCVRFNNNSSKLAVCCDDGRIYFWSIVNPMDIKLLSKRKLSEGWITSMDFFLDNESFSFSTETGVIGISILGNVDRYRLKTPVFMIRNQPCKNNLIEIAAATQGKGLKITSGSSIMSSDQK